MAARRTASRVGDRGLPNPRPARSRFPRGLLIACLVAEAVIVLPILVAVSQAVGGGWHAAFHDIRQAGMGTLILHTLAVCVLVTLICGAVGLGTAWWVERTDLPGRRGWRMAMVAPLTVPPFVTSYAWVTVSSAFNGLAGAVVITSCTYFPLVFLMVSASLRGLDPALEESARSLGCSPGRVFRRVVLPQVKPALLGGMLLVGLDALVEFDAFAAVKFQTFSTDVYAQYLTGISVSGAAVLSMVSIVLCIAMLGGEWKLRGGAQYTRVSQGARRPPSLYPLGGSAPGVLAGMGVVVAASLGVPLGTLVYWFTRSSHQGLAAAAAGTRYLVPSTATSVGLAIASAAVGLVLALPIAVAVTSHRGKLVTLLERGSYLSYALPDLVGAIALGYAAAHWARPLYESVFLLVVAYAILFVPLGVVALRATLGQIEPGMEDCARSLGAGRLSSLWRVTLPVARPGIGAAAVLIFAFVIGDLSTTQVLLPPGMYTLSTQFWSNSSTVAFAAAAPYAAVLIGLALIATYVLMSRFGRVRTLEAG